MSADRLLVLAVAQDALVAQLDHQLDVAGGHAPRQGDHTAPVRLAVERSESWARFVTSVLAGDVDEHNPDLPAGELRQLLPTWAREARLPAWASTP